MTTLEKKQKLEIISPKTVGSVESGVSRIEAEEVLDKSTLAGFPASYVNLVKTIIGAGILVLPYALIKTGLLLGLIMIFMAAALCILGLHLLNVAAMNLGRKSSFSGLCSITYPKAAFAFEFAIAVKCIGAGISYISIVGTTSSDLAQNFLLPFLTSGTFIASILASKAFWTLFFAALITPVCLMRKMDSLKYTSFGGLAAVLYLVCLIVWNFFRSPNSSLSKIPLFADFSFAMCSAYSVFVFAFTCHQNILPIQNESKDNTPSGMMSIIGSSIGTSTILYLIVSIFGAASYGNSVPKVILEIPDNSMPFVIARFMYVFLLVLSFPLQVFPCRICIQKMASSAAPEFTQKFSHSLYLISTFAIIATCAGIGALKYNVNNVLGWVGATAGTFICYFLPAIIYNKIYLGQPMDWRRISAFVLFIAGCLTLVLSVIGLIKS